MSTSTISSSLMNTVNGTSSSASSATSTANDQVQADTDKFLTLLVTQLKNQDPLNPLDNAQLTSQLAQLSTVTGINTLNATLSSLKDDNQATQALQAANMIGHGVLTPGTNLALSESASVYGVDLATAADNVTVVIRDSSGAQVKSIDLGAQPAGTLTMGWNGELDSKDAAGAAVVAKDGAYTFSVTATRAGATLTDAKPLTFGLVASVTSNSVDGVVLNVPSVGKLTMADVKQVL